MLSIKGHTGYHSCTKCTQEGLFINGRVTFPELNSLLRTDELCKQNRRRVSPSEDLNIGFIKQVPLDYMHVVCLGVMLTFWVKRKRNARIVDNEKMITLNGRIETMKTYIPKEFARTPRGFTDVERFKATEFRQILLYTGPLLLKDVISQNQYNHFLSLHTAIRILCSPNLHLSHLEASRTLLHYFVQNYGCLYGEQFISHNVHN